MSRVVNIITAEESRDIAKATLLPTPRMGYALGKITKKIERCARRGDFSANITTRDLIEGMYKEHVPQEALTPEAIRSKITQYENNIRIDVTVVLEDAGYTITSFPYLEDEYCNFGYPTWLINIAWDEVK